MKRVAVLGASGMVGSMLVDCLFADGSLSVVATVRSPELAERCRARFGSVQWRLFDAEQWTDDGIRSAVRDADWIVNAIGLTKPYIRDDEPAAVERAIRLNALFPHAVARVAQETGARVLHIATDCVYSGKRGRYVEDDAHDALDVYGKTKSLGESQLPNVHCLRCSIVGPEPKAYVHLLDWLRRQPPGARVPGYANHRWNGVTTLHFARLCHAIIARDLPLSHRQHLVPTGTVSKAELLQHFARSYRRADLVIEEREAEADNDRTLATGDSALNGRLWTAAGYDEPPTIPDMIREMSEHSLRLEAL